LKTGNRITRRICPECKAANPGSTWFCARCGTNLRGNPSTASVPPGSRSAAHGKTPSAEGIPEEAKKGLMRWGIGMFILGVVYAIFLRPLFELMKDDGVLGQYFSNTQNPPN
jgi:hypothetical protein